MGSDIRDTVGIDHIAFYAPEAYLSLEDLANARGVDPNKYTKGIGIKESAVASPAEDVVVLAANAGYRVLKEAGVSPNDIGLLIVGTESAEDKSKPTATHVHELLEVSNTCRVYDIIHACAGATYGVLTAIDWLHNPANKYALIIASDIARYERNSLGEPTQGAGAVALLLCRSPRLMALSEISTYSKNVYDFWKPLDQKYPVVDGIFSAQCYGEAAKACFSGIKQKENAAYLYHTPYPKLVQQTHMRIAGMIGEGIDFMQHYEERVRPGSRLSALIGNIYTGSIWLSVISFLAAEVEKNAAEGQAALDFEGCYLFSYGSGCGAALLWGEFSPTWKEMAGFLKVDEFLDGRIRLTVADYENIAEKYENPESLKPDDLESTAVGGKFRFLGIEDQRRLYGPA